jgi:hypothetical protein
MKLSEHESNKRHIFNNFMSFFAATCGINEFNGCRYSIPDADFVLFNSVLDTEISDQHTFEMIKSMQKCYQHKKQFCWWLTEFVKPQSIASLLEQNGFEKISPFSGMILDLHKTIRTPTEIDHIHVQTLKNKEQLTEWVKPLQVAFAMDDHSSAYIVNTLQHLFHDQRFKHFYVEQNNKMVGVGSLFIDNGISGFYNLGVLPEYRHQKIATALKYHRLKYSQSANAKMAILQSSIMGKALDQQLGFKPVFDFVPYLSPMG